MQIKTSNRSAFTLVEIMIVVAIIGLLAAIAIPNLVTAQKKAKRQACISTLKAIEGAKAQWALENKKGTGDTADWTTTTTGIGGYLKGGTVKNVVGETYNQNAVGTPATATSPVNLGTYTTAPRLISQ